MDKHFVEYRVRPVTRYIVTKANWTVHDNDTESASTARQLGPEYPNEDTAFEVAYALARQEHERLGYAIADERVKYPTRPSESTSGIKKAEQAVCAIHRAALGG